MSYIEATDQNFAEVVEKSDMPVVVDFWAPWCGPCKMLAPLFEKLANDYEGKVKFVKVNVDENPATAIKYNVRWIPSIVMFKGGQDVKTLVWVKSEEEYKNEIEALLWDSTPSEKTENSQKWGIVNVNWTDEFTKVLESNKDKLVLVDFWAPWCGPCRMLAPTLEQVAKEYEWKVVVAKVNVDEPANMQLAQSFQVSSIPMMVFIKDGETPEATVGALPYEQIKSIIEKKI